LGVSIYIIERSDCIKNK